MGIVPDQKLVVKHTFLEYTCEEELFDRKSLRQRSQTEPNIDEVVQLGEVREGANSDGRSSSIADKADQMPSSPSRRTPNSAHAASPDFMPATPEMSPLRYPCAGYMPMILPEQCLPEAMGCNPWFQQWSKHYGNEGWWTPMAYNSEMSDTLSNFAGLGAPQLPSIPEVPSSASVSAGGAETEAKETRTTVMLRGLPETSTRAAVLQLLDAQGFFGRYNFVYLPVDFKRHRHLGYALINLVSPSEALRFSRHFEGFAVRSSDAAGESICGVAWCSPQQGLTAHVERYRNSPVMHESVPEEWRPLLLAHGVPITFPPPTIKIKAPRLKGIQMQKF